ncbi:MAG TPA: ABC transporter permease [Blastocatellia bacterium]|nr:ABC transporter permease [Blastocatellia bacterium]
MLRKLVLSARALFQKEKVERELDSELRFHLEMEIEQNMRQGMSYKEARRAALRSFGGYEQFKEECRDVRGTRFIEALWQDLRYGARLLAKNPGYTLVAVLTLGLGIGANTAIFSVIYGVLLSPLPYADGNRLVFLNQRAPLGGVERMSFSVKEINDYRERNQTLEGVVEYHSMSFILLGGEEPERIQTGVVSWNFFDVMGVKPLLGRTFLPGDEEHGAEAVLILSHTYWQRSHGGDPNIVGKVFQMNNRPHTVIGVLPPIPQYPQENDVYMPTSACPIRSSEEVITNRGRRMMNVFGRLKPGVSVPQARADLGVIASQLQNEYPEAYPANRGYEATMSPLHEELTRVARPTLLILLGTAGLVLLIACANVANLTLARSMRRERELAIRAALGAGRGRLVRQLVTENVLLSLAGGGLGLLLAAAGLDLLVALAAKFTPRAAEVEIDASVLLFTLAVSFLTGIIFGLIPALPTAQKIQTALKEESGRSTTGAGRQRLRGMLLVAQVAVSFMLLIGAGLMVRSMIKLQQVNPGFDPERVLAMRLSLNWSRYTSDQQFIDFERRLLARVQPLPGVLSAAMASTYPMNPVGITYGPFNQSFRIEGHDLADGELAPRADYRTVSPDFFQTVRIPLIKGRTFTEEDDEDALRVAVINQSMARHRWGDEDPIGKRVTFNNGETWITIVGIVGDVKQYGLNSEFTDELYVPTFQDGGGGNLLIRTAVDPTAMIRQIRNVVHEVDPETAIDNVQTLEQARDETISSPRLTTMLMSLFAALALVITATGIAGVMALWVTQRTHEIGIRMALGATRASVLRMVLGQGLTLIVIGLAIGAVGAFALTRIMSGFLFGVEPTDPVTYAAVAVVFVAAATAACLVPARRATSIDPIIALRSE